MTGANLEIHFYDQDQVGIFMEVAGEEPEYIEILLFHLYVLRQLTNLGKVEPAYMLANLLTKFNAGVIGALVRDEFPDMPALGDYDGVGRKRFIAKLRDKGGQWRFDLSAKGFGLFATGVGSYVPASTMILMKYLASRRLDNLEYIEGLVLTAQNCGGIFLTGKLKSIFADGAAKKMAKELWDSRPSDGLM